VTPARAVAALAALFTAVLLQGALVGPLAVAVPASLPAVLVAAVALTDGPGTGLTFGFVTGLIADLASRHPAGVLALTWLLLGAACGAVAAPRSPRRRDAVVAAVGAAISALVGTALLAAVGADGVHVADLLASGTWRHTLGAGVVDLVLAAAVVPLTRALLRSDRLRRPRPVLLLGGER
jgi:cell shape-determining protein MreD